MKPRAALIRLAAAALGLGAWFLGGCATPAIPFNSNPSGAAAFVNSAPVGTTPLQYPLAKNQDNTVRFELRGYFPEELYVPKGAAQGAINVDLTAATRVRTYEIASQPPGAAILVDGVLAGQTPARINVTYARSTKAAPWPEPRLTLRLEDHQTENYRLPVNLASVGLITLSPLREERVYRVTVATRAGAPLRADVLLDGKVVGETPLSLPVTYQRADKRAAWPTFRLAVRVPGQYKDEAVVLDHDRDLAVRFTLAPLSEITTSLLAPGPVMTPTGVAWSMVERAAIAVLNTRETADAVADLKPVTNFGRQDLRGSIASRSEAINSFTVSPDGQNVIFSLTERDRDGNLYCNLFVKRADGAAGGIAQLTQGSRYVDTMPHIANDGSNYLVFTSNRGERTKPDVFRSNFVDNALSGGLSRLTNDTRFNFAPTYGEANRQVFYLSIEPNFPLAETQLSSIRINGSLPTQLPVTALGIDNSVADKVYFVRTDDDTKKMQIYSVQADGRLETALINQDYFRNSNCFDPAPSPDGGSRLVFVSDAGVDEQLRHNSDLYLMNADGTGLERLTQNGSDDIKPVWSPAEDGVIYFLSNRGGAYNIWRLKLRSGTTPAARH